MPDRQSGPAPFAVTQDQLARLLGGVGVLFVLVAGTDVLLTWFPTSFGNREWEFGTVTASFNGLLSIAFGFALIQIWLARADVPWALRTLGVVHIVVALLIIGAALLWARNVSIAMNAASAGGAGVGIMKAVIKTSIQSVAYPVTFLLLALLSFRWAGQIAHAGANAGKGSERVGIVSRS